MLAFQHVAVICPYLVFVTLILQQAHVSVAVATSAVSLAMLGIAAMTVLQAQRFGWIGSGFLAPPVVSDLEESEYRLLGVLSDRQRNRAQLLARLE